MTIPCRSEITQVVVHARGARITRTVTPDGPLGKGEVSLTVAGIPAQVELGSARAELCGGGWQVVSLQTARAVSPRLAEPAPITERRLIAQGHLQRLDEEAELIEAERCALLELRLEPGVASGRVDPERAEERFAQALGFSALVAEQVSALDARAVALHAARELAQRALDDAVRAEAQASSASEVGVERDTCALVIALTGEGELGALTVSYVVPAARWWPRYALRIAQAERPSPTAELVIEALVAQRSGEDWSTVPIALSTADLLADTQLPSLPALRLGRAQAPARPSYRAPPDGLDQMFHGYDRAFAPPPAPPPPAPPPLAPPPALSLDEEEDEENLDLEDDVAQGRVLEEAAAVLDDAADQSLGSPRSSGGPPLSSRGSISRAASAPGAQAGPSMPRPLAGGPPPPLRRSAPVAKRAMREREEAAAPPGAPEPSDAWLDFESLALAPAEDRAHRGQLRPVDPGPAGAQRQRAVAELESLTGMPGARDPQVHRGHFDHRYDAQGRVEIPSDALTHRINVLRAEGPVALRFRTVPALDPNVFREAELSNPFDAPLLGGPVDVYVDGALVTTAELAHVDRGGTLTVGLGVEERIRVARNARVEEEVAGLLRGSIAVTHRVTVELVSSLGVPAQIELCERVPVTDDKTVEVKLLPGDPAPAHYDQVDRGQPVRGGLRWTLALTAGGKAAVGYGYRVSLSAKDELVGGNRRE